ncbi:hypothetical protein B5X24_HaOG217129 [Helicoverpa armigera]|uniref:Uncharacterized protein n=1 Tax=Helicoverpa armigera TaxID=29058 RepID=A0A2W1C3R3_HELAM|nr:hypothetical protein B5X24_HaOG217129 [Helicoverpa armigera]
MISVERIIQSCMSLEILVELESWSLLTDNDREYSYYLPKRGLAWLNGKRPVAPRGIEKKAASSGLLLKIERSAKAFCGAKVYP